MNCISFYFAQIMQHSTSCTHTLFIVQTIFKLLPVCQMFSNGSNRVRFKRRMFDDLTEQVYIRQPTNATRVAHSYTQCATF